MGKKFLAVVQSWPTRTTLLAVGLILLLGRTSFAANKPQNHDAPRPPVQRVGLSFEEAMKETPGLVEKALAGPLRDVQELIYVAGSGYHGFSCYHQGSEHVSAGWGSKHTGFSGFNYGTDETVASGCTLYRINPRTGRRAIIFRGPHGNMPGVTVDYDGRRVIFAYAPAASDRVTGTRGYIHLYEIRADGSGLRQLTDGTWNDQDPCCLPS